MIRMESLDQQSHVLAQTRPLLSDVNYVIKFAVKIDKVTDRKPRLLRAHLFGQLVQPTSSNQPRKVMAVMKVVKVFKVGMMKIYLWSI